MTENHDFWEQYDEHENASEEIYAMSFMEERLKRIKKDFKALGVGQETIKRLLPLTEKRRNDEISFNSIKKVVFKEQYSEKLIGSYSVYQIVTDNSTFDVLLEYLDSEPFIEKLFYYLHAPNMNEENSAYLKKAIACVIKRNTVLMNRFNGFEEEYAKRTKQATCMEDFGHYLDKDGNNQHLLKKGEIYSIAPLEESVKVDLSGKYEEFINIDYYFAKKYFALEVDKEEDNITIQPFIVEDEDRTFWVGKKEEEKEEALEIPDIEKEFDDFLRQIHE